MTAPAAPRYAIYFTPADASPLWQLGRSVLGDRGQGDDDVPAHLAGLLTAADLAEARKYGFHATLRAPFELASNSTSQHLLDGAAAFAASRDRVEIGRLRMQVMGGFIALVCAHSVPALATFAADCVTAFEPFRAPLSDYDRSRRLKAPLTPRQLAHLDAWGYPYVLDDFIFHMTLTGPLAESRRAPLLSACALRPMATSESD